MTINEIKQKAGCPTSEKIHPNALDKVRKRLARKATADANRADKVGTSKSGGSGKFRGL